MELCVYELFMNRLRIMQRYMLASGTCLLGCITIHLQFTWGKMICISSTKVL